MVVVCCLFCGILLNRFVVVVVWVRFGVGVVSFVYFLV